MSILLPSKRILIVSSKTGGGHQSAAVALQESLNRLSPGQVLVNIAQVLEEAHFLTHRCAQLYNFLLRYHQHSMRYYYRAIHHLRLYESTFLFQSSLKYGKHLFEKLAPTVLVSVHPMLQHFFGYMLKRFNLLGKIPLITVVTDPCAGFWKSWAAPEVDQYFVASASARDELMTYGVASDKIQICGMPIHAKFRPMNSVDEKRSLRESLLLDPDRFTILVNAGWVGGGNVPTLFETLAQASQHGDCQIVFLTGQNPQLYEQALKMAESSQIPVKVVGFAGDMQFWMNASDVMISKPGGLTTFVALACKLPILADCLTPPMPQEAETVKFLEKTGAGLVMKTPHDVLAAIQLLKHTPTHLERMREQAVQITAPGAVDDIAQQILNFAVTRH